MEMYEISALLKYAHKKHQTEYECARLGAYMTAQTHTKKQLKLSDIMNFEWENDSKKQGSAHKQTKSKKDSVSDILRIRNSASEFLKSNKIPNPPVI